MSSVGRYDQKGLKWTGQSDRLLGIELGNALRVALSRVLN